MTIKRNKLSASTKSAGACCVTVGPWNGGDLFERKRNLPAILDCEMGAMKRSHKHLEFSFELLFF